MYVHTYGFACGPNSGEMAGAKGDLECGPNSGEVCGQGFYGV
jgi:hypothetical protein